MIDGKNILFAALGAAAAGLALTALHAADAPAPKAYVIAEISVTNADGYAPYAAATTPIIAKFGGHYIARGGKTVPLEGAPPAGRIALIEFPSLAAAEAFEHSPDYLAIKPIRQRNSTGRVFLAEGVAPTP